MSSSFYTLDGAGSSSRPIAARKRSRAAALPPSATGCRASQHPTAESNRHAFDTRPRAGSPHAATSGWDVWDDTASALYPAASTSSLPPSEYDYDADSDAGTSTEAEQRSADAPLHRPRKRAHLDTETEADLGRTMRCMSLSLAADAAAQQHLLELQQQQGPPPPAPPSSPARAHHPPFPRPEAMPAAVLETSPAPHDMEMRARRGPSSINLDRHRVLVTSLEDTSSDDEAAEEHAAAAVRAAMRAQREEATRRGQALPSSPPMPSADEELHINTALLAKLEELRGAMARDRSAAALGLGSGASARRETKKPRSSGGSARNSGSSTPTKQQTAAALVLWRSPEEILQPHLSGAFAFDANAAQKQSDAASSYSTTPASAPPTSQSPDAAYAFGSAYGAPAAGAQAFGTAPWPAPPKQNDTSGVLWLNTSDAADDAMECD
ncbi:hypothetical protein FA09DRAFT_330365 [Tilletiopsis washingtonensis]|uniref:Uncharacterized protein n=1 Tax=Tilletiopsis washingtonensis TaxID=58919 RepID=A0A316ZBW5_9BASI|nr:hypothetical protein FA09DRAFT_330365 [Tilletiopsis washingtonensis]PWN97713.1 hypothetical protein FA09DRAFT_330365 [Tilletiopsis washingtonensis]